MAQVTASVDGRNRMTLHVPVRVGGDFLVEILGAYFVAHGEPDEVSAASLLRIVRDMISRNGTEPYWYWHENYSETEVGAARGLARSWVHRYWPDLPTS